jgi:PAS domain S-box-containing protein
MLAECKKQWRQWRRAKSCARPWWLRFGAALICVAALTLVRALLDPLLGITYPFVTFYAAIALAAWFGGMAPGVFALLLGLLAGNYFFVSPRYTLNFDEVNVTRMVGNFAFCGTGLVICGALTALHRAWFRAASSSVALADEEQRLTRVLQSITDGLYVIDAEGRVIYMNGTAKRLLAERGLNLAELFGKDIFDEVVPEKRDASDGRVFRKAMSERLVQEEEIFYESLNRWYLIRYYPMEDGGLSVLVHDITARKHAVQRLQIQHAVTSALVQARSLREAAPNFLKGICEATRSDAAVLWSLDDSANILRCEEVFACAPDRANAFLADTRQRTLQRGIGIPGRVWASGQPVWIPDVSEDSNVSRAATAFTDNLHGAFAVPIKLSDEFFGVIEFFSRQVLRPDDSLLQMIDGISLQIAQFIRHQQAHEALRESEKRFQTLANNMSQLAWMANADGWIFWYNQRWLDYTGTTIEEIQGWEWKKVLHPDHVERVVAGIQYSWDTGEPWEDTFPLRGRDGAFRWFLSRAQPIRDADRRVIRWLGTNTDVTELRDVQESLRKAKDALAKANQSLEDKVQEGIVKLSESRAINDRQEKLASLGVFATGIAHEIRNPLTAIKVRLFSLKGGHKPGTSEREDLEVIRHEIDRLEHIVRDFLQFARPAEPELQTVLVEKLLRDVHDLLRSELASKSIEIKLEFQANQPVSMDPNKMKQVLINLVQNGADSIAAGGTVTLRSRMDRQVLNSRPIEVVVIDVADTGKGIPPEIQKRLFDPFFTTKETGTGLGLPIAARIVERHGGIIRYETQPNRGTTFSIVLPRAPKDENES